MTPKAEGIESPSYREIRVMDAVRTNYSTPNLVEVTNLRLSFSDSKNAPRPLDTDGTGRTKLTEDFLSKIEHEKEYVIGHWEADQGKNGHKIVIFTLYHVFELVPSP